jgi:hypothetical protein
VELDVQFNRHSAHTMVYIILALLGKLCITRDFNQAKNIKFLGDRDLTTMGARQIVASGFTSHR